MVDFSGALANGWIASLNDLVQKNFQGQTVPQVKKREYVANVFCPLQKQCKQSIKNVKCYSTN